MNGSTNVLAIAGDISLFGLRAVTSRTGEERAAEGTAACDMGRRVHRSAAGKLTHRPCVFTRSPRAATGELRILCRLPRVGWRHPPCRSDRRERLNFRTAGY